MNRGIFVSGTDTDIGKTYVTALLVKFLRESGINAGYYKAALSGAEKGKGTLIPGDAVQVCSAAGLNTSPNELVSYIFEPAVSPHLAARIENRPISLRKIQSDFQAAQDKLEFVVCEGSGGIICPLKLEEGETILLEDVIKLTGYELLIVADAGLGTINHVCLTVAYARLKNIPICGIVFNNYDKNNRMHNDNIKSVERLCGEKVVCCIAENAVSADFSFLL